MTAGRYEFNTNISGHRLIELVCPACRQTFKIQPGKFAQGKKRSGGRPMTCSQSCRWGLDRATKAAQRAEAQG